MNLRRSRVARATASVAALALLVGPSAAGAWAQETPAPEPTPAVEPTTTALTPEEIEEQAHDDGKHKPSVPKDNVFHLGQSMQMRVNADGEQNAKLVNFRWSVSHLTIQGPPDGSKDGEYVVPVPEGGTLPRYLENFGFIHVENGYGQWDMEVVDGWDTQRSVSIYPQDGTPNISLKTEFTLDGEPVKAQDIVGKDGLVTATYTLTNNTTAPYTVTVKDLNGVDTQVTAEGDQPMVAITKTLLPQRYIGLNTGSGLYGADGRGNNQVQWISLPFKPLAETSQASFGWAAYVTDAVIPLLLTQVQPLYIPAHDPEAEPEEAAAEEGGSAPIPLDPAVAQIQAGLSSVIAGLDGIAATAPADEPCAYTDPATGAPYADALQCLSAGLNSIIGGLFGVVTGDLQDLLNPALCDDPATAINEGSITCSLSELAARLANPENVTPEIWNALNTAAGLFLTGVTVDPPGPAEPVTQPPLCDSTADPANCRTVFTALDTALGESYEAFIAAGVGLSGEVAAVANQLTTIYNNLAAFESAVDLGTVEGAVAAIKGDLLARGGDQVVAGLDQVSAGVGQAKSIVAAYVSDLAAEVKAAVESGAASANEALLHIRGEVGALKAAAAQSPLIYGPLPPGMPEGTVLFAAYEFRIDAADNNHPYTAPRILIGLLALIAAGLIVKYVGNRNRDDDGLRDDYTASPVT